MKSSEPVFETSRSIEDIDHMRLMALSLVKQPLRSDQVSWRHAALFDTRRARARRELASKGRRTLKLRWLWQSSGVTS